MSKDGKKIWREMSVCQKQNLPIGNLYLVKKYHCVAHKPEPGNNACKQSICLRLRDWLIVVSSFSKFNIKSTYGTYLAINKTL